MKMATIPACDPRVLQILKQEVLVLLRDHLCKMLEPEKYCAYLRSKGIFLQSDEEEIHHTVTSDKKAGIFLDKLSRRQDGYDTLVMVLNVTNVQKFLVDELEQALATLVKKKGNQYMGTVSQEGAVAEDFDDLPLPPHPRHQTR